MIYVCVCILYHASSLNFGFVVAVRVYIMILWFSERSFPLLLHTPFICFSPVCYCVHNTSFFQAMLLQTFCPVIYIELLIRIYKKNVTFFPRKLRIISHFRAVQTLVANKFKLIKTSVNFK